MPPTPSLCEHSVLSTPPLLATHGIAKNFGSVVALRGVDMSVASGEIHALLGANGAGKSTLVKILSGVHRPTAGEVTVKGEEVPLRKPADSRDAGLATVFQDPALLPHLSVDENLRLTGVPGSAVVEWLEHMQVQDVDFGALIGDLPLPTLRLLDLARALAREPELLMLDEITAALPADQAEHVFDVMAEWKDRGGSLHHPSPRRGHASV